PPGDDRPRRLLLGQPGARPRQLPRLPELEGDPQPAADGLYRTRWPGIPRRLPGEPCAAGSTLARGLPRRLAAEDRRPPLSQPDGEGVAADPPAARRRPERSRVYGEQIA